MDNENNSKQDAKLQMYDLKTMQKLRYPVFKNQSTYMRCHKSFGINLGEGTAWIIFILLFWW